jgi:hypothetical protein
MEWGGAFVNELKHYGILGMRWGVRRSQASLDRAAGRAKQEKEYRQKLTAISKNKNVGASDSARFAYRNQNLVKRVGKSAISGVSQMLIGELMTGGIERYARMNKGQLTRELTKKAAMLTATTAANVVVNDVLAKSASKRYTNTGRRSPGTKDSLLTKEDAISAGVSAIVPAVYGLHKIAGMSARQANFNRAKNEARFNSWGQNILSEKVADVIWQSDDLKYAITR